MKSICCPNAIVLLPLAIGLEGKVIEDHKKKKLLQNKHCYLLLA